MLREKLAAINVLLPSRILLLVICNPSNDFIQLVGHRMQLSDYVDGLIPYPSFPRLINETHDAHIAIFYLFTLR